MKLPNSCELVIPGSGMHAVLPGVPSASLRGLRQAAHHQRQLLPSRATRPLRDLQPAHQYGCHLCAAIVRGRKHPLIIALAYLPAGHPFFSFLPRAHSESELPPSSFLPASGPSAATFQLRSSRLPRSTRRRPQPRLGRPSARSYAPRHHSTAPQNSARSSATAQRSPSSTPAAAETASPFRCSSSQACRTAQTQATRRSALPPRQPRPPRTSNGASPRHRQRTFGQHGSRRRLPIQGFASFPSLAIPEERRDCFQNLKDTSAKIGQAVSTSVGAKGVDFTYLTSRLAFAPMEMGTVPFDQMLAVSLLSGPAGIVLGVALQLRLTSKRRKATGMVSHQPKSQLYCAKKFLVRNGRGWTSLFVSTFVLVWQRCAVDCQAFRSWCRREWRSSYALCWNSVTAPPLQSTTSPPAR